MEVLAEATKLDEELAQRSKLIYRALPSAGRSFVGKPFANKSPAGKPFADKPSISKSVAGKSIAGKSLVICQ